MVRDKEAWRAAVHENWQLSNNKEDCIGCLLLSKGILFSVFLWKQGAILHWLEHVLFCILVIRIILCINKTYLIKRASLIAQLVKNPPAVQETWFHSWVEKIRWRKDRLPTPVLLGFPCGPAGKESTCNMGDLGSVPGSGRSPGEGKHGNQAHTCFVMSVILKCINTAGEGHWWRQQNLDQPGR